MTKKEKRLKSCLEIKEKKNLVILIWGLGKTGQSLVDFFKKNTTHTINTLNSTKTEELINHHYHDDEWEKAIAECDYFIPSPGILLPQLAIESEKHIPEFDLFYVYWKEKIIAITGSVGKTSITSLINQQLENHFSTYLAGNIGIPLFSNVLSKKEFAIIEASNLQLQHTLLFAPDYAIITNLYENHLDYHKNFFEYIRAKTRIYKNDHLKTLLITSEQAYVKLQEALYIDKENIITYGKSIRNNYFFDEKENIYKNNTLALTKNSIPEISYSENWLCIYALLDTLNIPINNTIKGHTPQHRLEYIPSVNAKNITFINDSKSTVVESTVQAYQAIKKKYPQHSITILIGGISKGVDRIKKLSNFNIKENDKIIFFGKESDTLLSMYHGKSFQKNSLLEAINFAYEIAENNEIIVLSPGGASFDEFKNYEDRGIFFKEQALKTN